MVEVILKLCGIGNMAQNSETAYTSEEFGKSDSGY